MLFLKIRLPDMGVPFLFWTCLKAGDRRICLIFADLPFFAIAEG
ncbi:hypothetical protein CSC35_0418 [Enterobacter hormaechei]|nr:hypothetical protein CSC35_0418 [Enterobacter hormaechei]